MLAWGEPLTSRLSGASAADPTLYGSLDPLGGAARHQATAVCPRAHSKIAAG